MGHLLQMVSVEVGMGCNMSAVHPRCPNNIGTERYAGLSRKHLLDDDTILAGLGELHRDFGFNGWVNFSFYNEPLLQRERLFALIPQIAEVVPGASFMLITNGTLLPEDLEPFRAFRGVWMTNYGGDWTPDPVKVERLKTIIGDGIWPTRERPSGLFVSPGNLDIRMRGPGKDRSSRACVLPFKDLAFDGYGNAHICCIDWRGDVKLGNMRDGIAPILQQWERTVRSISGTHMTEDAPATCRSCRFVGFQRLNNFDPKARQRAKIWLREMEEVPR
jgi:hypothetical protein